MGLPLGIFEHVWFTYLCVRVLAADRARLQDILPKAEGLVKRDFGQCAIRSDGVV